ncbi:MAG: carbon starvation CstA family protein, partial [Carnobacterium sp.]
MITLLGGIALLIVGYIFYGRYIEKNFTIDPERTTPAEALKDGYDFVPMSKSKNAIIQLLNIAGT